MLEREDGLGWLAAITATAVTAFGWALWIGTHTTDTLVVALGLHLGGATVVAWAMPRHRGLALALGLAVPVIGAIAAALAATARGHGDLALDPEPHPTAAPTDGAALAHTLARTLPACEAVVSPDADTRRAALANLARFPTPNGVAILRWARASGTGDIALEAALAFEETAERFEHRVSKARDEAARTSTFETTAHAFRVLAEGIRTGIVDARVVRRIAAEARGYHDAAIAADAERAGELIVDRVHLELAMGRPQDALELLAPVLTPDLMELYEDAAYAARRFELVPELPPRRGGYART